MRKPTIIGPSIYNFKDVVTESIESNALIKINRFEELPLMIKKLGNKKTQQLLINNSKKFISKSEGSSNQALKIISQYF